MSPRGCNRLCQLLLGGSLSCGKFELSSHIGAWEEREDQGGAERADLYDPDDDRPLSPVSSSQCLVPRRKGWWLGSAHGLEPQACTARPPGIIVAM